MGKKKEEREEVLTPCRRGKTGHTRGQSCTSKVAYKMSQDGSKAPVFKCKGCGFTWTVPVGGSFSL